jgi:hypothetical protein
MFMRVTAKCAHQVRPPRQDLAKPFVADFRDRLRSYKGYRKFVRVKN